MPLTDVKIRQAKATDKPIKLTDGNGLYLEVRPNGSKLWRYRYRIAGKENLFAIGEYPTLSLQEARQERERARELVKLGQHPSHVRQIELSKQLGDNANTFEFIAREWLEKKKASWSAYSHRQALLALENNVFPKIGRLPIRTITPPQILDILQTMESRGAVTYAIQVRKWISTVFCYAASTLRAETDPAALLKGALHRPPIDHSKPMAAEDIADFLARVRAYGGNRITSIALELLLLTFVRTVELRKAEWSEVDLDVAEWKIPADKMKMRRVHVVPLAPRVVNLLRELQKITGAGRWLFPSMRRPDDVMSSTTINRALEHMGYGSGQWTGHDFRATASTRLHEMGFAHEHIELQLGHAPKDKVASAYNHAKFMPERRAMIEAWADWIEEINQQGLTK